MKKPKYKIPCDLYSNCPNFASFYYLIIDNWIAARCVNHRYQSHEIYKQKIITKSEYIAIQVMKC